MIQDVEKLGIYPEIDLKSNPDMSVVEYEDFEQIFGDSGTFIYKPVAEWINNIVNREDLPLLRGFDYTTTEGDYED